MGPEIGSERTGKDCGGGSKREEGPLIKIGLRNLELLLSTMYPPHDLVRLLNWCSDNGIHIHPNLNILHEKKNNGICVRAANCTITPEQSRKRGFALSY